MIAELPTGHEEMKEALGAAALDALSSEERESVMAHVDQCEVCRAELTELRRCASQLSYAAPLEPIDQGRSNKLRAQLLARAESDRNPIAISSVNRASGKDSLAPPSASRGRVVSWLATAALAASIVALAALIRERGELARSVVNERSQRVAQGESLRTEVAERDALLAAITGPQVKVIALTAPTPRPVGAVMFWDRASDQWTFIAHDLPQLQPGKTYQLWLVLESIPRSVGVFDPDALGNARMIARLPLNSEARPQIAVTEEPRGGSLQPTSDPVIVGQVSG